MKKPRLAAIEYIRGISMMGVIGIHVGSLYIQNPASNPHLMALLEIFTRFSVPIFFFISAFGLFYNLDPHKGLSYMDFLKRRFRTVLVPYLAWSLFYILHDSLTSHAPLPDISNLFSILFFGNAKYQLYFMVILLWFYLLMPLWVSIVRRISWKGFALLLLFQIIFNEAIDGPALYLYTDGLPDDSLLKPFLVYRLNYWVFPYIFIFLLGGWLAVHSEKFQEFMQQRRHAITVFFWLALAGLLGYYYKLLWQDGYTQLEAVYTAHQLCPPGVIYTLAASLFFFTIFTYQKYPGCLNSLLSLLGRHSYFAYLVHPLFITYLSYLVTQQGYLVTAPIAIGIYFSTLGLSLLSASITRHIGQHVPILNQLTIGVYPKK